jgi:hypothetical protein
MKDELTIKNFAHLAEVDLVFGDLTVLVGAQGAGKSLALQWLKLAVDGRHVTAALRAAGQRVTPETIIDLVFGSGMSKAWHDEQTQVRWRGRAIRPDTVSRQGGHEHEALFFVPAHRAMLVSDGWAAPFQKLGTDVPVVARLFSQNLYDRFSDREAATLFPVPKRLKQEIRDQIDRAVFHGGKVGIEEDAQHRRRLRLVHTDMHLPFMTWTAGQREFTPLLLGLYHLLPPTKLRKRDEIDWVVIEEPEMGLHPRAITVVLLLILDLLWRGYRVVLSTHSPHVLAAVWMLQRLREHKARWQLVCDAFEVERPGQLRNVAEAALEKDYRVHQLFFDGSGHVRSKDISTLDADSPDDAVFGWGGLAELSSRFGEAVRRAVNENKKKHGKRAR